ncbi:glucose-1-phosphate thymidylyltransferase [Sinosporangium album]|uniref:Glucose-1-phosphate thymidylyltransferase n=1 Tax=Sinosporangium album TaxID=504805 RepID=A0A1G7ZDP3_9ACTN|nr:glucose-1-phosphate thymidylyltransferase RfbA [Sinosporangium album]SDH06666.1 glucose-1-phosphate thymidylyltransferase [Sinosporangium album]
MKGIVLAGGSGTRLHPITLSTSKQLLPVYDKPMIYYPFAVLMMAEIRDVLIISTPDVLPAIQALFGDGSQFGVSVDYAAQTEPRGIADAFLVGERHVRGRPCALVLGDNIFHGPGFGDLLTTARKELDGCALFGRRTDEPSRFAIAGLDAGGTLTSIEEKPAAPLSDWAVTGLYFYDENVVEIAKSISPSARGELEITDVNRVYLGEGTARMVRLDERFAWLDAGTSESLLEAGRFVRSVHREQGVRIACLEEIALHMGFIDADHCHRLGFDMRNSEYGRYVMDAARRWDDSRQG